MTRCFQKKGQIFYPRSSLRPTSSFLCCPPPLLNLRGSLAPALRTRSSLLGGLATPDGHTGLGAVTVEGAEPLVQSVKCPPVPYGVKLDWCLPSGQWLSAMKSGKVLPMFAQKMKGNRRLWVLLNRVPLESLWLSANK